MTQEETQEFIYDTMTALQLVIDSEEAKNTFSEALAEAIFEADTNPITSTDDVPEGSTNLYFTSGRALSAAPAETTTTTGALINGAGNKATPVDADYVGLMDSAASNVLKKLSWANIKTTLASVFVGKTGNETIAGEKTFSGKTTINITAVSSTGEVLQEWKVSDDADSYIRFLNASAVDGVYAPTIKGYRHQAGGVSLLIEGSVPTAADISTNPIFILRGKNEADSALVNKALLFIQNYTTNVFRMDVSGRISLGANAPNTRLDIDGDLSLRETTPAQITADQNNYATTGYSFFRLSTDASRNITGFAGGFDGKIISITNVGSFNIVIPNQSASSTAANRVINGSAAASITLAPNDTVTYKYDTTTNRWKLFSKSF